MAVRGVRRRRGRFHLQRGQEMGVWSCRSKLGSVNGSRVRIQAQYPQSGGAPERGPSVCVRPGLGRGASVDPTGAGSSPAGSSAPRRHALGHSPGVPAINLVSRVEHGCPRIVNRRSMRVMRTNNHGAIGMVVAFAATAGVHREFGTSRFTIIQRRPRCVSECSLVFCP
jgi:hypothetical protein